MQPTGVNIKDFYLPAQKTDFQTIGGAVSVFLPKILILAGIIFFFLTVIAGVGVITGAGTDDAQNKEKAKNFLTYAVIGFVIIFASYWIVQLISFVTFNSLKGLVQ